jgi:VIT1/CCC1 family predicted Fe2+/Mn2+ transporter
MIWVDFQANRLKNETSDMSKKSIAQWGFLIAGILFLFAAIIPYLGGESVRVSYFVVGIALLLVGKLRARRAETLQDK